MKICQHKDISPAQHLKIPLLDAYHQPLQLLHRHILLLEQCNVLFEFLFWHIPPFEFFELGDYMFKNKNNESQTIQLFKKPESCNQRFMVTQIRVYNLHVNKFQFITI